MRSVYRALPSKISLLRHNMNEFLTQKMRQVGWNEISPSHGGIIYVLLNHKVLNMKEIAEKVKRDPSTVTTLVNKLIKLGYAEYTRNPNDLRSKQVRLTDEGKSLYNDFYSISMELTDTLFQDVEDEEIDSFMKILERMNKSIVKKIN